VDSEKWERLYLEAIREVDAQRVVDRIAKVRSAIQERLRDLDGEEVHAEERHKINKVLNSLEVLEVLAARGDGKETAP
jgi:hypothetical protein